MKQDIDTQAIVDLYSRLKSQRAVAKELGISRKRVRRILDEFFVEDPPGSDIEDQISGDARVLTGSGVSSAKELMRLAGVDDKEWIIEKKMVNSWDAMSKDGPVKMHQIKLWLTRRPSYFIQKVTPVSAIKRSIPATSKSSKTAVIIPDSQHGFRSKRIKNPATGIYEAKLIPMHDRKACDAALIACQQIQPDEIILMGDMVDFAGFGKYSLENNAKFLIQPMLQELSWWLQSIRLACPTAKITYTAGNHEERLKKAIQDHLPEAEGLRPADDPDGPPVLSVPRLLGLDKMDIDYIENYGKPYWLFDKIKCHHGHIVRPKGGQTTSAILSSESQHSHIVGHIHRREMCSKTTSIPKKLKDGKVVSVPHTIHAMSPGCLCSLETDKVPAVRGKPELDWQHGVGRVDLVGKDVFMTVIPIEKGRFVMDGHVYQGEERIAEIRRATGLNV
tara:strand:- start:1252 stop:2592 length:1341 start_codon:yes stop_codon:yes gene_type:complete